MDTSMILVIFKGNVLKRGQEAIPKLKMQEKHDQFCGQCNSIQSKSGLSREIGARDKGAESI